MTQTHVLLTGGRGFLGRAVARAILRDLPRTTVWAPSSKDFDLRQPDHVERCFRWASPSVVVHLACPYGGGGIGYAQAHPAELALGMVQMDSLMIEAAQRHGVKTLVGVGSVCAYPEVVSFPTAEDQLWSGHPERVNASYGLAKRMQLALLQAARAEWGMNGVHLILANLYGPGDHFGTGLRGHVIPSTILKVERAIAEGAPSIQAWGDGTPTREFLYIDDAAAAVARAVGLASAGVLDTPEPINVVSGEEVSIRDLVDLIAARCDYRGGVAWDPSRPNGQYRRHFSNQRAYDWLGWRPEVDLQEGVTTTIAWYRQQQQQKESL